MSSDGFQSIATSPNIPGNKTSSALIGRSGAAYVRDCVQMYRRLVTSREHLMMKSSHDQRVNLIINHGRQLGRSLLLLAHYTTVFVAFVGRSVQWMVDAVKWTSLFARYTVSVFDSIHRHLHWGKRKSVTREICPSSDTEPH